MSKVLFVIKSLGMGGSTTSLMNMLELLDGAGHKVDLFVMEHEGMYFDRAHRCSHVLAENPKLASSICIPKNVNNYGLRGLINRIIVSLQYKVKSPASVRDKLYKKVAEQLRGYDVVVSYQESMTTHFSRYIPASKKIAWVHTIYERFAVNISHDDMLDIYSSFDEIVCVAPAAVDAFKKGLPELADRVCLIPNPLNSKQIIEMSKQPQEDVPDCEKNIIVSVGRLSKEKQYDMAIRAAKKLKSFGIPYKWYIIGDGNERNHLTALIREEELTDTVVLLGLRNNPYPIIARADVLVISSLYEAQPMVANEALILDVPVITTNYPSAKTLIDDGGNGLICETTVDGIYEALNEFFTNEGVRKCLKTGAQSFEYDNTAIVKNVLDLCEV